MTNVEIRMLARGDEALLPGARDVFDDAIDAAALARFLATPNHHLAAAIDNGVVVGFVSSVHYEHPDKPAPELWINEVGVASGHQQRGIGKALIAKTLDHARALGCSEAWVLTDRANDAAMALYASAGGAPPTDHVMFTFRLDDASGSD